jgi:hypothetical protein
VSTAEVDTWHKKKMIKIKKIKKKKLKKKKSQPPPFWPRRWPSHPLGRSGRSGVAEPPHTPQFKKKKKLKGFGPRGWFGHPRPARPAKGVAGPSPWPKWGWPATPMVAKGGGSATPLFFSFFLFLFFIFLILNIFLFFFYVVPRVNLNG